MPSNERTVRFVAAMLCAVAGMACGSSKGGGPEAGGTAGMEAAGASGIGGAGGGVGGRAGASGASGASGGITGQAGAASTAGAGGTSSIGGAGAGGSAEGGRAGTSGNAGADSAGGGQGPSRPLGLNDVTILTPLPPAAAPVLLRATDAADDGTALVPRELFARLTADDGFGRAVMRPARYELLELVAVRFDLCDRGLPGACPEAEDGRMRLVFQPIVREATFGARADDVGFHAFYAIRNAEISGAVATLRELAGTVPEPGGVLRVSPALSAPEPEAYASKLGAFVRRYGGETRLVRLTMNAQPETMSQVGWALRGVEKRGDAFADIAVVGTQATLESVVTSGSSFDVTPTTGIPPALTNTLSNSVFLAADTATQRQYLAEFAAVDNPLSHTAETVACFACHVSTFVLHARSSATANDLGTLPGRYTSTYELSTEGGKSAVTQRTIRALGYLGRDAMISQRVVNETAQTLTELEQRYPAR